MKPDSSGEGECHDVLEESRLRRWWGIGLEKWEEGSKSGGWLPERLLWWESGGESGPSSKSADELGESFCKDSPSSDGVFEPPSFGVADNLRQDDILLASAFSFARLF
jgi:hypothetical protein